MNNHIKVRSFVVEIGIVVEPVGMFDGEGRLGRPQIPIFNLDFKVGEESDDEDGPRKAKDQADAGFGVQGSVSDNPLQSSSRVSVGLVNKVGPFATPTSTILIRPG